MNAIIRDDPSDPIGGPRPIGSKSAARGNRSRRSGSSRGLPGEVDDRPSPAFLVGFPRSGTTLLDTILMSHPGTEVLEEEPALMHATEALGGSRQIPAASRDDVERARDDYFEVARSSYALEPGKLLVDKNPLSMNSVPVDSSAIPRREDHPRAAAPVRRRAVLLRHQFQAQQRDGELPLARHRCRTLRFLLRLFRESHASSSNRRSTSTGTRTSSRTAKASFGRCSISWSSSGTSECSTTSRRPGRGHIKTASYAQVVEPIYKRSAGRWENYRKHLEPVLPVLRPWVEKFDYSL